MLKSIKYLMLCGLIAASPVVSATPITEPDQLSGALTTIDFNGVTSISGGTLTFPGVVISGVNSIINTNLYSAAVSFPDYVSGNAVGRPDFDPAPPNFTITFDTLVGQVGLGLFDQNFTNPATEIKAYGLGGVLLETTSPDALFPPGGSGADYVGFTRTSNDISYLEIVASPGDAMWIDNLAFGAATSVPAPATIFFCAMFGLLGFRKRS